jgi:hypothetical protein
LTQLSSHCPNFRAIALSLASLSKDCRLYQKTQLSSVWPIFRVFAVSIGFNIFRESGPTFERSLSLDSSNFRAGTIVRLPQLSITLKRLIPATFDTPATFDWDTPSRGNCFQYPSRGNCFQYPSRGNCFQYPSRGNFSIDERSEMVQGDSNN